MVSSVKNLFILFLLSEYACETFATQDTLSFKIRRDKAAAGAFLGHGYHLEDIIKSFMINDSISLYKFLDDGYYGKIVIGHPGKKLDVSFDTTWSYSWVLSSKCSSSAGCFLHKKYDHSKSFEYKKDERPFSMDLGNYNLTGFFSYDTISIAHSDVTNQSFIEMVDVPENFVFNKADGVMGLGLKTDDNYNPFFYTLLAQKKVKNPIFSIYLNRDRRSYHGGNVMLGFIDPKHIHKTKINNVAVPDNFTYLPVDKSASWQFQMDQVVVNDKKNGSVVVCKNGCKTIVDTTSDIIVGPKEDIDQIHDLIEANEFLFHRYTVKCDTINKLPKIDFILSGKNFTLQGEDYTIKLSHLSVTVCFSAFMPAPTEQEQGRWILGGAFLAQFYSVYNVEEKKIGFVKSH